MSTIHTLPFLRPPLPHNHRDTSICRHWVYQDPTGGKTDLRYSYKFGKYICLRTLLKFLFMMLIKLWIGLAKKFVSDFSIPPYRKTQTNFITNPIEHLSLFYKNYIPPWLEQRVGRCGIPGVRHVPDSTWFSRTAPEDRAIVKWDLRSWWPDQTENIMLITIACYSADHIFSWWCCQNSIFLRTKQCYQ